MGKSRKGRGRLSSIDQLPEEADRLVADACQELRQRDRTQKDILADFNAKLLALGEQLDTEITPISATAFNRYSVRLARITRRVEQTREIATVLTKRLEPGTADDLTIAVTETIKTLVFELLEAGGEAGLTMKAAKEAAEAVRAAAAAQKISTDRRAKVESEFSKRADAAIDKVAKAEGFSQDTVRAIKANVLGLNIGTEQ